MLNMEELVRTGDWREWLKSDTDERLIDVYLRRSVDATADRFKFKLSDALHKGVTLFFPQTTFESDKVLYVDEYKVFADLDHAIFNALAKSKGGGASPLELAVYCETSNYCFRIHGVQSNEYTYYLYWMDTLTRYDKDGYSKPMAHKFPCLFEMDGNLNIVNIVCLSAADVCRDTRTLSPLYLPAHAESFVPMDAGMMFNCENLSRAGSTHERGKLKTVDALTASASVQSISTDDSLFNQDVSIYLEEDTLVNP